MKPILALSAQTSVTQRVQQAIALLPMSLVELNDFVQDQLNENPFLKESKQRETSYSSHSSIEYISNTLEDKPSVMADVLSQFRIRVKNQRDLDVGYWILHNLDDHGFFGMDIKSAAYELKTTVPHVEKVLLIIQALEPVGIATRGIAHCWKVQLQAKNALTIDLDAFLNHVDKLTHQSLNQVAKTLGINLALCQSMLDTLRALTPYPLDNSAISEPQVFIADILTQQDSKGQWYAALNPDAFPDLEVDTDYLHAMRTHLKNADEKSFVREKIGQARWLIQALQERAVHLLTVAESLLDIQYGYWVRGEAALHPLTLKDVAKRTGLHISTISRLTTNKYIQTPYGIMPLKFFFSRSLTSLMSQSYDNEGASSKTIQHRLREFLHEEKTSAPYSDDRLVDMFQDLGILVARRTINKYRQLLNIPSSSQRKRLYTLNPNNRF